jgi:hypothetical protein
MMTETTKPAEREGKPNTPSTVSPFQPSTSPPQQSVIEKFPAELRQHLAFENGKLYSEYVSKEKWTQMNIEAEKLGYEWVKAGKDSHWRVKV